MNKRENTIKTAVEEQKGRQPQMAYAVDKLGKAVDEQVLVIGEMEKKLMPVLSPTQKVTEGSAEKAEELVPLASVINGLACRLRVQNQRINDLIERLEV